MAFVADELGMKQSDILPPDATHADNPPPIADYFIKLFDVWFDKYAEKGVRIDTLDAMIRGLAGQLSLSDTIGLGPIETVTLMADGSLEPLDVLRIAGDGSTASKTHVRSHAIKDVENDPVWREAFEASTTLCEPAKNATIWTHAAAVTGAALVHRAQVRQSQRLLRELEAHLRPYLGPDRAHIDGRSRACPQSPLSAPRWCPWRESNPHSLRNTILSRARLPVPPHGHRGFSIASHAFQAKGKSRRASHAHRAENRGNVKGA